MSAFFDNLFGVLVSARRTDRVIGPCIEQKLVNKAFADMHRADLYRQRNRISNDLPDQVGECVYCHAPILAFDLGVASPNVCAPCVREDQDGGAR